MRVEQLKAQLRVLKSRFASYRAMATSAKQQLAHWEKQLQEGSKTGDRVTFGQAQTVSEQASRVSGLYLDRFTKTGQGRLETLHLLEWAASLGVDAEQWAHLIRQEILALKQRISGRIKVRTK